MSLQPTRNREIEAVDAARDIVKEWFIGYNNIDVDYLRDLCHYPLVSFGGGRVRWHNLVFTMHEDQTDFMPNNRDFGWDFSLIDRWAVHHHSTEKSHLVIDFSRLRADGMPYAVGLSRLAIITKEEGRWGVKLLSSCGMRNPASVEQNVDAEITAAVTELVSEYFGAFAAGDDDAVESVYHYPFVNVDGTDMTVAEEPADLDVPRPGDGTVRPTLLSMEILPPQAGDKVVVDVNVQKQMDGSVEHEGAVLLATKQEGEWGIQLRSVADGSTVVP